MKIQWLGHSAFKITGTSATLLVDPFLTGNPKFSGNRDEVLEGVTHVLLTHGHNDHFGDTIAILEQTGATLIATPELAGYANSCTDKGHFVGMNIGGTVAQKGFSVSMVQAFHSSSYTTAEGAVIYGGMPTGLIIAIDDHVIYHMGDTGIFADMALINEMYQPDIGIVPIGDHFTMDSKAAALAVNRYFDFKTVIPCHYLTFPLLTQSADTFVAAVEKAEVKTPSPMDVIEI